MNEKKIQITPVPYAIWYQGLFVGGMELDSFLLDPSGQIWRAYKIWMRSPRDQADMYEGRA